MGILTGWYRRLNYVIEPFVSALYATPSVALLPLYIIWFGIGINSKIAVIFMSGIFYVLIYARVGVTTVDANILKCARSFGASDMQLLRTVVMPSSVPFLFTVAGATFQTDKVFVGVLIVTFAGVALTEVLKRIEERFSTWRPRLDEEATAG